MKYTVTLPPLGGSGGGDVGVVAEWQREIGALVREGDVIALVRRPDADDSDDDAAIPIISPAYGVLAKKMVLPGEAVEAGEPLAILSGVPEPPLLSPAVPPEFAAPPAYVPGGPEDVRTLSPAEQRLGRHMAQSRRVAPHVATVIAVDLTETLRLRERVAAGLQGREGIEIGLLPFVVSAAAAALLRFPSVNAQLIGDTEVRRKRYVHVGFTARAEAGRLVAPVVRNADTKSVLSLAREIADLTERAHAERLAPVEMRGATFSLTDALSAGGDALYQTPILHQPQAAILSLGAVVRTPVALREGDEERIVVRPILHLCLSHDARIVESETAAAFLADVKRELEEARFLFGG